MNRRHAVTHLTIAAGGFITLPFWMTACHFSDTTTHLSSFSPAEQGTLAKIVDTIIPAGTGEPGALAAGVDKFLIKLIDDCYEPADRDKVKRQLAAYGHSEDKDQKDFLALIKSETIRGFNTSQKVMEDYLHYKVAPGHYYGCIDIKA
jgi:hypothetical protein